MSTTWALGICVWLFARVLASATGSEVWHFVWLVGLVAIVLAATYSVIL